MQVVAYCGLVSDGRLPWMQVIWCLASLGWMMRRTKRTNGFVSWKMWRKFAFDRLGNVAAMQQRSSAIVQTMMLRELIHQKAICSDEKECRSKKPCARFDAYRRLLGEPLKVTDKPRLLCFKSDLQSSLCPRKMIRCQCLNQQRGECRFLIYFLGAMAYHFWNEKLLLMRASYFVICFCEKNCSTKEQHHCRGGLCRNFGVLFCC